MLPRPLPLLLLTATLLPAQPPAPKQPLPFSHKQHVSTGLTCKECHANPDPGEIMGIPATSKCMACHIEIAKQKPTIQRLAAYAHDHQPIPWVRVYRIPSYVSFSHRVHLDAKFTCENCHGPVQQRDTLSREVSIAMGACVDCHRQHQAGIACDLCHEPR